MVVFEDILSKTGWGTYNRFLIALTVACIFTNALSFFSASLALSLATCTLKISDNAILWITICHFFGIIIGTFLCGLISDLIGKACIITTATIFAFFCNFTSGFAYEEILFGFCFTLLGTVTIANSCALKINIAELMPTNKRGAYIVCLDACCALALLASAGVAHQIGVVQVQLRHETLYFVTWRTAVGVSAVLCLLAAGASALLQRSPRALLAWRRTAPALATLRLIYAVNRSRHGDGLRVRPQDLDTGLVTRAPLAEERARTIRQWIKLQARRAKALLVECVRVPVARKIALASVVRIPLAARYLLVTTWLLKSTGISKCRVTGVSLVHLVFHKKYACEKDFVHIDFLDFFIVTFPIFVGLICLVFIIDRVDRRIPIITGFALCSVFSITLSFLQNAVARIVMSALYMVCYSTCIASLDIIIIENFPTMIRGTALAISYIPSALVMIFCLPLLNSVCDTAFLFMGIFMFASSILSIFLPSRTMKPMYE